MTIERAAKQEVKKEGLFSKLTNIQKTIKPKSDKQVVFLLDRSGSMDDETECGATKEALLIESVSEARMKYEHRVELSYIAFNDHANDVVFAQVLTLKPSGGTAIYRALEKLVDKPPGTQAVLVTDGLCEDPFQTLNVAKRFIGIVTIHCIACGEYADEELLQEIARLTGGSYTKAGNPVDLPFQFLALTARAVAALNA